MLRFRQEIGIDLGTATVIIYAKGSGIVLREPSVAAIDKMTGNVYAVGSDAQRMLGRTPSNIVAIRPLRDGVISDYDTTEKMLKKFLDKVKFSRFFKPNIVICVPSGVTEVEERAVIDVALQAGAKKAYVIEEPIAAAIGAGLDIAQPMGHMIVDIGGGTTDIAVISLGGVVASASIKVAGDTFDDAIIKYVKKRYNVLIGERTAEEIKVNVGSVVDTGADFHIEVRGRNLMTGLPKKIEISSSETVEVLQETAVLITDAIHRVIEKTPPELVGDIYSHSIVLTGGGALMHGMPELIEQKTGIHAVVAEEPTSCVAIGTGMSLEQIDILQNSFGSVAERKHFE